MAAYNKSALRPVIFEHEVPFSPQSDYSPGAPILICLLFYCCRESDRAHNTIPEFLVQNGFVRIPVVLDDFVESVDQWLLWRHIYCMTSHRESVWEITKAILTNLKHFGEILDIIRRCFGLTIEDGGDSYFISPKFIGDFFESEIFDRFSLEDIGWMEATKGALVAWRELGLYVEFTDKCLITLRTEGWVAIAPILSIDQVVEVSVWIWKSWNVRKIKESGESLSMMKRLEGMYGIDEVTAADLF